MIPHNNELQKKFAKRGLVVVGVTNEPGKLVEKYVADNKVEYPIFIEKSFKSSSALGVTGYPSAYLIDPAGTVVWSGHPASLPEAEIEKALKNARPPMVKLPASLKPLEKLLERHEYGKVHESLKGMLAGKLDDESMKAGQDLQTSLEADAKATMAAADQLQQDKDFAAAGAKYESLVKQYAGVPGSEGADVKLKELQANPEAKKSMAAAAQLQKASDVESAGDYDKAYTAYRAITKSSSGTKAADAAAKAMADIEKKGMLGFDSKCPQCKAQQHACSKHKKKPPT
jgi:hypothetical protein